MPFPNASGDLEARSDDTSVDPSVVQLFASEIVTAQYFNAALGTALVYHSVISMDKEIKYFWANPRLPVSIIYFANRYIGLLGAICNITLLLTTETPASCIFSLWALSLANMVTILLIDYILRIRVLAIFHQNKTLSITLTILLVLEAGVGLGILIYGKVFQGITTNTLVEGMTVCILIRAPPQILSILSWTMPLAYGFVLLCLTLYKATEYWKPSSGFKGIPLVRVLVRDQVIYYAFVIFCSVCKIVDIAIVEISPFVANLLSAAGSPSLLCILGSHLLINLKEAGERGANGGTNHTPKSISDMDFGEDAVVYEENIGEESA